MNVHQSPVWIVGASSGIGAALATELAGRGARVAVTARRREPLEEMVATVPGIEVAAPADVTSLEDVRAAHQSVVARLGAPQMVVMAAGYWRQADGRHWDVTEFDRHVDVNLRGLSHVISAALPQMLDSGRGTLAGIASVAGYRGIPGSEYYGATKSAQITLLESLRASVAARGVRVVTVCPGFVRTEMTAENDFPMPFLLDPGEAARSIAAGLAADRHEIVFPLPMAVAMKAARWAPVGLWARAVRRRR